MISSMLPFLPPTPVPPTPLASLSSSPEYLVKKISKTFAVLRSPERRRGEN
jgi:hypothetical protein